MIIGCESAHALAASAPFEPEPRLQRPEVSSKLEVSSGYAQAGMAELADAADSKSAGLRPLGVRPPLPAPKQNPCNHSLTALRGSLSRCARAGNFLGVPNFVPTKICDVKIRLIVSA